MRSPSAPRVATWLLNQFGCSANNEAIIGDLNERYHRGRSRLWYWSQVFRTIVAGLVQESRVNKGLVGRALITGWALAVLGASFIPLVVHVLRGNPRGTGLLPANWTTVQWVYVRGWIVPAGDAYVLLLICTVLAFGIGWALGRMSRPNEAKAVLIFVGSWMACLTIALTIITVKVIGEWSSPQWRHDNGYFLVFGIGANLIAMLALLAGGLLSRSPAHSNS